MSSNINSSAATDASESFRGLTSENQSGLVAILTTFALSLLLLSVPIRLYVRGKFARYGADDASYFLAVLAAIGQVAAVYSELEKGLGRADILLNPAHQVSILKAAYAAEILYIITLFLSKLSTAFLFLRLTPRRAHHYAIWCTIGTSAAWAIASVFMLAFRCNTSMPWLDVSSTQCSTLFVRYQTITSFDIITEIFLFSNAIFIVWGIQMSFMNKSLVVCAFAARLPTIPISALRLCFITPILSNPPTFTNNLFLHLAPTISCAQLEIGYSILSSIVPYLKNFMAAFEQTPPISPSSQELTPQSKKPSQPSSSRPMCHYDEIEWAYQGNLASQTPAPASMPFPRLHSNASATKFNPQPTLYEATITGRPSSTQSRAPQLEGIVAKNIKDEGSQKMIIKKGVEWSVDFDRLSGGRTPIPELTYPGPSTRQLK